jgi:hypothetical protein
VFAELESRCGLSFNYGPLAIPHDAADGVIQARIAYPDASDARISAATLPIQVK